MNKRISLTDDEQALLQAVLDYTIQRTDNRLNIQVSDKTDILALRFTRRALERLRDKIFPRARAVQPKPAQAA